MTQKILIFFFKILKQKGVRALKFFNLFHPGKGCLPCNPARGLQLNYMDSCENSKGTQLATARWKSQTWLWALNKGLVCAHYLLHQFQHHQQQPALDDVPGRKKRIHLTFIEDCDNCQCFLGNNLLKQMSGSKG